MTDTLKILGLLLGFPIIAIPLIYIFNFISKLIRNHKLLWCEHWINFDKYWSYAVKKNISPEPVFVYDISYFVSDDNKLYSTWDYKYFRDLTLNEIELLEQYKERLKDFYKFHNSYKYNCSRCDKCNILNISTREMECGLSGKKFNYWGKEICPKIKK